VIDLTDVPDPYGGRVYDIEALLEEDARPTAWRTHPLTADGTLTVLSSRAGIGKTWLMYDLAHSVVTGTPRSGFGATHGRALIFDAEMGKDLVIDRFRKGPYSPEIKVFNAMAMDLKNEEHRRMIAAAAHEFIGEHGGGLIGFDSLRRLCPAAKENDSDAMAPIVSWIAWLMREVNGAGLLIHHEGWGAKRVRGSSAILDQVDAAWGLHKASESDDEDTTLKLSCDGDGAKKPRYCVPPASMFLRIAQAGGVVAAERPKSKLETRRGEILVAVESGDHKTQASIAQEMGLDRTDSTFRKAWKSLDLVQDDAGFWKQDPSQPAI
jgi:hypothetical protein